MAASTESDSYQLPAHHLKPLIRLCGERFIDLPRLLMQEQIDLNVLQQLDTSVDYLAYVKVLNRAAHLSRDPSFGLQVGRMLISEELGVMGVLVQAQNCIANIYPLLGYLFHIQRRGTKHDLVVEGDLAFHNVVYLIDGKVNCDQLAQVTLSGYHTVFSQLLGEHWRPSRVWLRQNENHNRQELTTFFGCPIEFSAHRNAIEFPRTLLYQPSTIGVTLSHKIKRELTQFLDECEDLSQLISQFIEFQLRDGHCDKASVAQALGVHPRVLQNCLSKRGLSYQSIFEQVRQKLATASLANTELSIATVAQQLGFSDARAFIRAFKGWFGTTPLQWRKQQNKD